MIFISFIVFLQWLFHFLPVGDNFLIFIDLQINGGFV